MSNQNEQNDKTDQPQFSTDLDNTTEEPTSLLKALLLGVGGLILLLSIFALLPMFFTYLSEGDTRAPSEIHATDSARKRSQSGYMQQEKYDKD